MGNRLIDRNLKTLERQGLGRGIAEAIVNLEMLPSLDIGHTNPGERVKVETLNSTYNLKIKDPSKRTVCVEGGEFFPTLTKAIFQGSTFGTPLIKAGYIVLRMNMEMAASQSRVITTSPVRKIELYSSSGSPIDIQERMREYS